MSSSSLGAGGFYCYMIILFFKANNLIFLSETTCFTFRFHESEDISLTHGALYVTHDKTVLVVQELHSDLGNLSSAAGAADDLHHNSELDGGILQGRE